MRERSVKELVVGAVIALLVFATVPLAQAASRHDAAAAVSVAGHTIADSIGGVVTSVIETHTRMSVALSRAAR